MIISLTDRQLLSLTVGLASRALLPPSLYLPTNKRWKFLTLSLVNFSFLSHPPPPFPISTVWKMRASHHHPDTSHLCFGIIRILHSYIVAFSGFFTVRLWHYPDSSQLHCGIIRILQLHCGIIRIFHSLIVVLSGFFTVTIRHFPDSSQLHCGIIRILHSQIVALSSGFFTVWLWH